MLQDIGDRISQQTNNAMETQSNYNNFEKNYFRMLNDSRQVLMANMGDAMIARVADSAK